MDVDKSWRPGLTATPKKGRPSAVIVGTSYSLTPDQIFAVKLRIYGTMRARLLPKALELEKKLERWNQQVAKRK